MSDPRTIVLLGASGRLGSHVLHEALGRTDVRVIALGRRAFKLPLGGRSQLVVCEPERWGEALADIAPDAVACAIGGQLKKTPQGIDEFRAIELEVVLAAARAAIEAEVPQWITLSAAGADRHIADDVYRQVKGEAEASLIKLKFRRLDILRPGPFRGARRGELGLGERLSLAASPVLGLLKPGARNASIVIQDVARSILQMAREKAPGRFTHDNEAILRAARRLPSLEELADEGTTQTPAKSGRAGAATS